MNKKILIGLLVIIIASAAIWFYMGKSEAPEAAQETAGFGASLAPGGSATALPETNPFGADTNPIKKVQTNPFE